MYEIFLSFYNASRGSENIFFLVRFLCCIREEPKVDLSEYQLGAKLSGWLSEKAEVPA